MAALYLVLEWLGIGAAAVLLTTSSNDWLATILGVAGIGLAILVRCTRLTGGDLP